MDVGDLLQHVLDGPQRRVTATVVAPVAGSAPLPLRVAAGRPVKGQMRSDGAQGDQMMLDGVH